MLKIGDHVRYVGPNKDWREAGVSGVVIEALTEGSESYLRIIDDKTGKRKYAATDRWELIGEPVTKTPTRELWWQKKDREQRELRSRCAALHLEIRRITGME